MIALGAIIFGATMTGVAWTDMLPPSLNGTIFFIGIAIIEVAIITIALLLLAVLIRKIFK